MNDLTFYCAGSSKALYYAAAFLMEEGAVFLPCPDHTVTHLLLPIPSFEADGSIKGGGDLLEILSQLPRTVTVIGGNLHRPELDAYDVAAPLDETPYVAKKVTLPLRQHVGAPAQPVVELGDTVEEGALVACIPEGALSANIHASIGGTVVEVNANQIVIQA